MDDVLAPDTILQCNSPSASRNFTLRGLTSPSAPSGTCFLSTGGCLFNDDFLGGRGTGWVTRMCRTGLKGASSVSLAGGSAGVVVWSRPRRAERREEVRWTKEPATRPTRAADASCCAVLLVFPRKWCHRYSFKRRELFWYPAGLHLGL